LGSGSRWEEGSPVDERPSAVWADAWSRRFDHELFLRREVEAEGEMDEGGNPGEGDGGGWVEEVVPEFFFDDVVRALLAELGEHADGTGIGLLGSLALAVELKGLDHSFIPVCHHDASPFGMGFGEA
jgi:hypothetical protein